MDTSDIFSLLQDPETMQKLSGLASELMENAPKSAAAEQTESAPTPQSPDAQAAARLTGLFASLSQNADSLNPARAQLLHALRPFLSDGTGAQIAHAERVLSMARMAKQAMLQLTPPENTKEV